MPQTFLSLYSEYASEFNDCADVYHEFTAITTLGSIMGLNCFIPWGQAKLYPNFWSILIGRSSKYHKNTAINIGQILTYKFNPKHIYPNEWSHEKLVARFANQPCGHFYFGEFKNLSSILDRDYNYQTKSFLTNLYDGVPIPYLRETMKEQNKISDICFSISTATTLSWLLSKDSQSDFDSGWFYRWILIPAPERTKIMEIPPLPDKEKERKLLIMLKEINTIKAIFYLMPEAKELYKEWYRQYIYPETNKTIDGFLERLSIVCIKIAMVLEMNNSMNSKIEKGTMQEAINYTNWLILQTRRLFDEEFTFTPFEGKIKKIKDFLQINKNKEIYRTDLMAYTRFSSKEMDEMLKTMEESEIIQIKKIPAKTKPLILIIPLNKKIKP